MRRRRPLITTPLATGVAFSLLAAGCGGGGGSAGIAGVASSTIAATTTLSTHDGLPAFSQCMRANGAPNFPDPQHFVGGNVKLTIHQAGTSPRFRAALSACDHLLPSGPSPEEAAQQLHARLADELSFATCMRSHGVAHFPDPTAQGELSVEMVQAQGIDVRSPQILRIVQACLPASHGALTPAKVREALNNAGR
jgi:hypothetical protein